MTAVQSIPDGSKVYLDANVVIYAVEGAEPFASSVGSSAHLWRIWHNG